ncbi:probable serine/threonine-protein kinase clkA [Contarinia nasturtii]|uniref:probable serine/threonine-protein kinase clkA n=1 Tax=Contarinia nasturtii TaxID=265458 RepID=UPI0012D477EF|nr:probable serine/threonine-protein kinase clkA [Contarinia nasturtii]
MEYCNNGYNGMVYHHSPQHNHEFRYKNGMMKVGYNNYNNAYGHSQHINWNGMHHPSQPPHHHHHSHHHPHAHHQYGNRNISSSCHYESYKANMVPFQSSYSANFESSPYESTATAVSTMQTYRSRYGGAYQMCDTQQCFPNGENGRSDYMPLNGGVSRCNNIPAPDPRSHQTFIHESATHHPQHMRMPPHSNNRTFDSHPKARQFETGPHQHHQQPWYGNSHNSSETINESNHHYYQYHAMNNSNYNEYPHGNQYSAGAPNGQMVTAKEDKPSKLHRDRSLSKLVAMNRRLETQMSESERIEQHHHESFENFDYYTDYSTPDSITTSSSQYTNNDCIINNGDTDNNNNNNNNNINDTPNNSQKCSSKETRNQQEANNTEWQTTPTQTLPTATPSNDTIKNVLQTEGSICDPSTPDDGNLIKKNDLPSVNITIKSPAKLNTNKKVVKCKKANNITKENSWGKRRKRKEKKSNTDFNEITELKTDTIPLPAFQQAFGSTEIGRFSEIFFNVTGSPIEIGLFESEADTLSPQPWEMGDSLEGPHFSMQANSTPLSYAESLGSTDSPTASNNSYFSDLRASEF